MRASLTDGRLALALAVTLASLATTVAWAQSSPFDPGAAHKKVGPQRFSPTPAQAGAGLRGLVDKMSRLWVFDCSIPENRDAVVSIHFVIGADGTFKDGPTVVNSTSNPAEGGAASGALRALKAGQPYSPAEVPLAYRNQGITINFKTKNACAGK